MKLPYLPVSNCGFGLQDDVRLDWHGWFEQMNLLFTKSWLCIEQSYYGSSNTV